MFKLISTIRRGSPTGRSAAWARAPTMAAARLGVATLLRDDRILRVMIVRNEIPGICRLGRAMNPQRFGARPSRPDQALVTR